MDGRKNIRLKTLNQFQHPEQLFRGYPQSRPQRAQWIVSLTETCCPQQPLRPACCVVKKNECDGSSSKHNTTVTSELCFSLSNAKMRLVPFPTCHSSDYGLMVTGTKGRGITVFINIYTPMAGLTCRDSQGQKFVDGPLLTPSLPLCTVGIPCRLLGGRAM